jgi:hypothetical protein
MHKITDTYKAAYFMTQGARLVDIEVRSAEVKDRVIRSHTWVCIVEGVTQEMRDNWMTNTAIVNVDDLVRERNRIKRLAKSKRL